MTRHVYFTLKLAEHLVVREQLVYVVHVHFVHVLHHLDSEGFAQILVGRDLHDTAVRRPDVHPVGLDVLEAELGAQETSAVLQDLKQPNKS